MFLPNATINATDDHPPSSAPGYYYRVWPYFEIYCTSMVFVCITALVWVGLWAGKARFGSPARYFTVIVYLAFNIVAVGFHICDYSVQFPSYGDHRWFPIIHDAATMMQILCLVAYVFFWLAVLKKQTLGWSHVTVTLLAAALLIVATGLASYAILLHAPPGYVKYAVHTLARFVIPTCLVGTAVLVDVFCIYRVFVADKTRTRDLQILRWCSVTTLPVLVCILLTLVLHLKFDLTRWCDYDLDSLNAAKQAESLYGLAIFLVFVLLNVEVLALVPGLKFLLDFEDPVPDQDHIEDNAHCLVECGADQPMI